MLTALRISGFAIVDQVEVRLGPGLNVLTGETGAGKSILLEALHLVLGGRMSADVLREGADEAVVEALFELPPGHPVTARLAAAGLGEPGATELLVRRVATRGGRGRAFVNGALCTVAMLEAALRGLVDVTGQHEHVALLDEATHLHLLDAFAGLDRPDGGLAGYAVLFERLAALSRERELLLADRDERGRRADYLAFQLREIEAAAPAPGELVALERERQVLGSAERLRDAARTAESVAYGDEGSAGESLGRAVRALGDAASLDARLEPALALLRSALAEVEEAGRALGRYGEQAEGNPERLEAVEERLELLRALARKHGGSIEAALARAEVMREELVTVEGSGQRLAAIERELGELGPSVVAAARELGAARASAAETFSGKVERRLAPLGMGRCSVQVAFSPPDGGLPLGGLVLGKSGAERARILIAPNPGEPLRPLARIASGGELSRILLAVKRALAEADPVLTYVFDEVDAGIGGGVAEAVGRLLAEVARERQVLCVTHLAQVAAFAHRHLLVEKTVREGRSATRVSELVGEGARRGEVARMLAGATITGTALEHAGALLAAAREVSALPHAPARGRRSSPVRSAARRVRA